MTAYARLLAFVERETELIATGDWESLAELGSERREVVAALPEQAPAHAGELLRRCLSRLDRNAAALGAAMAQTRGELDRIRRSRTALGSYAQGTRPQLELRGEPPEVRLGCAFGMTTSGGESAGFLRGRKRPLPAAALRGCLRAELGGAE